MYDFIERQRALAEVFVLIHLIFAICVGLNMVNPVLSAVFILLFWSATLGLTSAFEYNTTTVKHPGWRLISRLIMFLGAASIYGYQVSEWNGVIGVLYILSDWVDLALLIALVAGYFIRKLRANQEKETATTDSNVF